MSNITMRDMLEAGVHFGHRTRFWNPKMAPYIYGSRHQVHIINLEQSLPMYRDALNCIHHIVSNKGKVMFVGTKPAAKEIIREEATRAGMPFVDHRWLGGMLTNYKTIRQSIKRLKDLELIRDSGGLEKVTKKEGLTLMRELNKLEANLSGIKDMGSLPDALFIIDVGNEKTAIAEARRLGIPVICVVDTNNSPEDLDYIIPGNDDSVRAIRLYCKGVADVILDAREHLLEEEAAKQKEKAEKIAKEKAAKAAAAAAKPPAPKVVTKKKPADTKLDDKPAKKAADAKPAAEKKAEAKPKAEKKAVDAKPAAEKAKAETKPKPAAEKKAAAAPKAEKKAAEKKPAAKKVEAKEDK